MRRAILNALRAKYEAEIAEADATANISQIFNSDNSGGTVAMAFRTNGTTSYTNSYIKQLVSNFSIWIIIILVIFGLMYFLM